MPVAISRSRQDDQADRRPARRKVAAQRRLLPALDLRDACLRGFGSAYFTPSSCARAPCRTLVIPLVAGELEQHPRRHAARRLVQLHR